MAMNFEETLHERPRVCVLMCELEGRAPASLDSEEVPEGALRTSLPRG